MEVIHQGKTWQVVHTISSIMNGSKEYIIKRHDHAKIASASTCERVDYAKAVESIKG